MLSFALALDRRAELQLNVLGNANLPTCIACTFPIYVDGSQVPGFIVLWGAFENSDKVLTRQMVYR